MRQNFYQCRFEEILYIFTTTQVQEIYFYRYSDGENQIDLEDERGRSCLIVSRGLLIIISTGEKSPRDKVNKVRTLA